MYRGNFRIADSPFAIIVPTLWRIEEGGTVIAWLEGGVAVARLSLDGAAFIITTVDPANDRIWMNFYAGPDETVWGGGEQMSYLALNGRRFPMWTSEPGVGRDKTTALTRMMDEARYGRRRLLDDQLPQPTFLTSRWLAVHLDAAVYSVLDFTNPRSSQRRGMERRCALRDVRGADPAVLVR